jgi:NADH-quinone oxidoreductase subunit F
MRVRGLKDLEELREEGLRSLYPEEGKLLVGTSSCGLAAGAREVLEALSEEVEAQGLKFKVAETGCLGFCSKEPLVELRTPTLRVIYPEMRPAKARELISSLARGDKKPEWALFRIAPDGSAAQELEELPLDAELEFYKKQKKLVLRNCGLIDPTNIREYIARGGYFAAYKALTQMEPEEIIEEIKTSGLRGRGGAGFPTGRKWEAGRRAKGDVKYVICNGDEGDPGAYMDRSVLEGNPHAVIEGMIIGAYAVGAHEGYVYVRAEYPLAVKHLREAIAQAEELGLLGDGILGSDFDFKLNIFEGAGAFVCGESTALTISIEGGRGMPKSLPRPRTTEAGLWGKPTVLNNVETWANVPQIIANGGEWYGSLGTETSKGTKVFALTGKVERPGLVEVPMGLTLRELVFEVGGGPPNGKRFKAVQIGGPSGGCIPAELLDLPVDYESLTEAGAMMGSGGLVVMDETSCMVDVARYFLDFTQKESCGQCVPCRVGTKRMLEILTRITEGEGTHADLELLEELAHTVAATSLCGLGTSAPNPVLTTLRYFRDEYEEHIKYKRCPAAVCREIASAPCHHTCPIGTDAAAYIGLIAQGRFREAVEVNWEVNPLASICGRVCHHPCERRCRSGEMDHPIAIKALKRFLTDYAAKRGWRPRWRAPKRYSEKIAIVGSGPAGLLAGWELARRGYRPTIFEALPIAGGMLAVGIPDYRLPKDLLHKEIEAIQAMGVEIRTNTPIGKELTLEDLLRQGYKAIFIATGAHQNLKLGIPGEEAEGVLDAVEFLRDVNLGRRVPLGKRVVVIGGGDTAIDAARTARRLGAEVTIYYRRTQTEMPARPDELEQALDEGIRIEFLAAPVRVLSRNGRVEGLECVRMKLGEFDRQGRRRPEPIPGSDFTIEIDTLIPAIGQRPDVSFMNGLQLETTDWGTLNVDPETLATDKLGVFAGGDVVSGPATVIEAMRAGKVASESIHRFLRGESLERTYEVTRPTRYVPPVEVSEEELERLERPEMPLLPVAERMGNFKEVELGLTEELAVREARRCLRCDLELGEEVG